MRIARVLSLLSLALLIVPACGGDSSNGTATTGTVGPASTCGASQGQAEDGTCFEAGLQGCADLFVDSDGVCRPSIAACPKGKIPKFDEGCVDVGIPGCASDFMEDDGLCHPRMDKCP